MTTPSPAPPRTVLARQLAFGFGSVVAVALTMCALLLALINDVAGLVTHMRHDESSISAGLQLATAVREQALELTRALVGPSADALERHQQARARVQAGLDTLGPRLPEDQRDQLGLLQADLRALDTLFRQRLRLTARTEAAASAALLDRGAAHPGQEPEPRQRDLARGPVESGADRAGADERALRGRRQDGRRVTLGEVHPSRRGRHRIPGAARALEEFRRLAVGGGGEARRIALDRRERRSGGRPRRGGGAIVGTGGPARDGEGREHGDESDGERARPHAAMLLRDGTRRHRTVNPARATSSPSRRISSGVRRSSWGSSFRVESTAGCASRASQRRRTIASTTAR